MKTETQPDRLFGQEAINFAIEQGHILHGNDYSGPIARSRMLSDNEAQEVVNEGIIEGVWCWTSNEPPDEDGGVDQEGADFDGYYPNDGFRSCSCEDRPCCGH